MQRRNEDWRLDSTSRRIFYKEDQLFTRMQFIGDDVSKANHS